MYIVMHSREGINRFTCQNTVVFLFRIYAAEPLLMSTCTYMSGIIILIRVYNIHIAVSHEQQVPPPRKDRFSDRHRFQDKRKQDLPFCEKKTAAILNRTR